MNGMTPEEYSHLKPGDMVLSDYDGMSGDVAEVSPHRLVINWGGDDEHQSVFNDTDRHPLKSFLKYLHKV